jgi:Tol biopolymer transport system component
MPRSSLLVPAMCVLVALILALATVIVAARLLIHDQAVPTGNGPIVLLIVLPPGDQGGVDQYEAVSVAQDGSRTALPISLDAYSCPTYSPDGQHLAYVSGKSLEGAPPLSLVIADADGLNAKRLWAGYWAGDLRQIVWSRDSSRLYVNGAMTNSDSGIGSIIATMPDGTTKVIAQLGSDMPGAVSFNGVDPNEIAFISTDGTQLQVIETDTGTVRAVATGGRIDSVSWSPDGTTIAYAAASGQGKLDGDLYFVDPDGSNLRDVTAGSVGAEGLLAWSPDGRLLAVKVDGAGPDGAFQIVLFDRHGQPSGTLGPFTASSNFSFTWSPDSQEILLGLGGSGLVHLNNGPLIAAVDGGPTRSIGVAPGEYFLGCPPSWQPVNQ